MGDEIEKNEMGEGEHLACVRERRVACRIFGGEDLGIDGRILRWIRLDLSGPG
jgi:hypothetical protein